jgi:hypothetical protein
MDNVDTPLALAYLNGDWGCCNAWKMAKERGELTVPRESVILNPAPKSGQWSFNSTRIQGCNGTKIKGVSAAMTEGRRQAAEVAAFMRQYIPGFENALLTETAAHIGVRETRRILCEYTITGEDIYNLKKHDDVIARGNWPVDVHNPDGANDSIRPIHYDGYYEIPYRSTTVAGVDNLLVASRCLDATHEGHAAVRASPQICAIGQGAGTAAAHMVARNLSTTRKVDVAEVQSAIRAAGGLV